MLRIIGGREGREVRVISGEREEGISLDARQYNTIRYNTIRYDREVKEKEGNSKMEE